MTMAVNDGRVTSASWAQYLQGYRQNYGAQSFKTINHQYEK